LKSFAVGQTPTAFEISFTPSSSAMIPAPETSSGAEMSTPARRKKKGVSNAKEIDRIRSISDPVRMEQAGHDESTHVRGQHRLAPCRGGQGTQPEEHREQRASTSDRSW